MKSLICMMTVAAALMASAKCPDAKCGEVKCPEAKAACCEKKQAPCGDQMKKEPCCAKAPKAGAQALPQIEPIMRVALDPKMAEKLGLTPEQVSQLKALSKERRSLKGLHEKVRMSTERQSELLKAEKIDEAAVLAAVEEAWLARKEIAVSQTRRLIKVRSILTCEQIAKARAELKNFAPAKKVEKKAAKKPTKKAEPKESAD